MCSAQAPCCPVLSELVALRSYKEQADIRIRALEQELAALKPRPSAPSHSDFDRHKSLRQLCTIESDLQRLSSENASLRAKVKKARGDLDEWQRFGEFAFAQIAENVCYKGELPKDDHRTQVFILRDLLRQMCERYATQSVETPEYGRLLAKYERTRAKLRDVRRKCDRMLAMIAQNQRCGALRDLGEHVQSLCTLAKDMKADYGGWRCRCGAGDE